MRGPGTQVPCGRSKDSLLPTPSVPASQRLRCLGLRPTMSQLFLVEWQLQENTKYVALYSEFSTAPTVLNIHTFIHYHTMTEVSSLNQKSNTQKRGWQNAVYRLHLFTENIDQALVVRSIFYGVRFEGMWETDYPQAHRKASGDVVTAELHPFAFTAPASLLG